MNETAFHNEPDDNISGYRMIRPDDAQIGWLKYPFFHCMDCGPITDETDAKVFLINIRPYSQTCHKCKKLVVDGIKKSIDNTTPLDLFTGVTNAR
jgi:hypothetical protein